MKFELLPNEIFIECFQYLNAPDIFNSFDRLNYRFHLLIRNSPLHLNFQQFKKFKFNEFCQTILSNPEIKQNIISLQLSNKGTNGQIQLFLSLISLNEFMNLRSLSLIDIRDYNCEQLLPMLPFLSNLYNFSCISLEYATLEVIPALLKSKIRILAIPGIYINSTSMYETMQITSLTICHCELSDLCIFFKYTPMLKYLKINNFYDSPNTDNELMFTNINALHLNKLIVDYSNVQFQNLELLLKRMPSLNFFSIYAQDQMEIIDANRWQHLIESSLPHLHVFKFKFDEFSRHPYNQRLIKLQQFQTDFWHKQHHWYTNYEINYFSSSVYTIPYVRSEYELTTTIHEDSNSDEFDNVKKLTIWTSAIRYDSPYYFRNVELLRLTSGCIGEGGTDESELQKLQIEYLGMIVNLSNIKHLKIAEKCYISSSVLLTILYKIPYVSSLTIRKDILISFLENRQLCKCLNKKIKTLDITGYWGDEYIQSNEVDLFCDTFSNVEQLQCYVKNLDDLLLILSKCSQLSMINIMCISKQICSWIETNASTLNVYIDFTAVNQEHDDDM